MKPPSASTSPALGSLANRLRTNNGDYLHVSLYWQPEHFSLTLLEPIETGFLAFWALQASEPGLPQPLFVVLTLVWPQEYIMRISVIRHIL